MVKDNCLNCSNRVNADFCTMHLDMKKAMYQQCNGFTIAKVNPSRIAEEMSYEEVLRRRADRAMRGSVGMDKESLGADFMRFIENGGHWSFREKKEVAR